VNRAPVKNEKTFMNVKIGDDVSGTFTDFIAAGHGPDALIHRVLSTPQDPSIAVLAGWQEIAQRVQLQQHGPYQRRAAWHHISLAGGRRRLRRFEAVPPPSSRKKCATD